MTKRAKIFKGQIVEFTDAPVITAEDAGNVEEGGGDLMVPHPTKQYVVPVEIVRDAFDPLTHVEEGPFYTVEVDRVVETWTVRAKTEAEVAGMVAAKVEAIKAEASDRITRKMPTFKQINWLAQGLRNVLTLGPDVTKWPKKARDDAAAILAAFGEIEAVRAKSDAKEAEVAALADPAEVARYDVGKGF